VTVLPPLVLAAALAVPEGGDTPSAYRVGPGDVLEIVVEGRDDLSRLPTVQTSGTIFLPGAGQVAVGGLTPAEIAVRLSHALAGGGVPPHVTVRVREYQSQFVWVRGSVNHPGRKALRAGTRLVDALLDAGGFAPGASGRVTVERTTGELPGGSQKREWRFSGTSPSPEEIEALSTPLRAGDVVTAEAQSWVRIDAGVARPGRYPFDDGLTLGRLVEAAGGRAGSGRVVVERAGGEIEADLDAIRDGRAADVPLAAGDAIVAKAKRR
jgi:protein involved in polysaccharide export with SLBB domain